CLPNPRVCHDRIDVGGTSYQRVDLARPFNGHALERDPELADVQRIRGAIWHDSRPRDRVGKRQAALRPELLPCIRHDALPHRVEVARVSTMETRAPAS